MLEKNHEIRIIVCEKIRNLLSKNYLLGENELLLGIRNIQTLGSLWARSNPWLYYM